MRKCLSLLGASAVAVLLFTSASAANRGVTFTPIGFISGPTCVGGSNAGGACTTVADCPGGTRCQVPASSVVTMNPDATVFMANPSFSGNYCVQWTRDGGWGTQVGVSQSACRISADGTIMANGLFPGSNPAYTMPGTWTGVLDVWDPIPTQDGFAPCGNPPMSFQDMGGNGDFATGLTWQGCSIATGFLWDKATDTTISLGRPNGRSTRGNAVTADGSAVIGWGTMPEGLRRAARWENGTWTFLGDPNGESPKECVVSGGGCTSNSSGAQGCPEYVDDASCANQGACQNRGTCQNRGVCTANVCVGGTNPGASCTSNSQCRGACAGGTNDGTVCTSDSVCSGACVGGTNPGTTCTSVSNCTGACVGGPSNGANCNSNSACPDTLVCAANPNWNVNLFKGEAYDVTDDGQHATGRQICYPDGSAGCPFPTVANSGWVSNPDGTFTAIPPPADFPNLVDPFRISQDGKTVVGRAGSFFTGIMPIFWNEGIGTQALQLFLVQQGLDEMYFWQLAQANDVSADGTVIGGTGFNPDGWQEGFIVDLKKLWVCHSPSGHPESARTLGIDLANAGDHVAHGDFLGTCEFLNSGGLSRAAALTERLTSEAPKATIDPFQFDGKLTNWNGPASIDPAATKRIGTGARPKLGLEQ